MTKKKSEEILITKDGLKKLQEELDFRSTTKKEELKNILEQARQAGDLSENDGYTLAHEDNQANDLEIARLKDILSKAKVVENSDDGVVELGDTVTLKDSSGKESTYTLVGEEEADILNGKISYKSPLGASIIGKKEQDSFKFESPRGKVEYKILSVKA